jgi:hypothetical protein
VSVGTTTSAPSNSNREGATVTYGPPSTGFIVPTQDESRRLMNIVRAAYPRLTLESPYEFHRAMLASGYMFRLTTPHTKLAYVYILKIAFNFSAI